MYAWGVIDCVAVPGPPPRRMFGMSMILKPSMSRMRMIVVVTGSSAGKVMCRNACQRLARPPAAAGGERRLTRLLVQALERGEQHDESERRPLPRVADDHGGPSQPRV